MAVAPVFIVGWYLVTFTIKQGNETYHTTFSYYKVGVTRYLPSQLLTMATQLYNIYAPGAQPLLATNCTILSCTVRDMWDAGGVEQTYIPTTPLVGTASGIANPANIAGVASAVPSYVGRGVRGRFFMPGSTDNHIAGQLFTSAYVSSLTTLAAALRNYTGLSVGDLVAAIASRKHGTMRTIVTTIVANFVDNQIRRLINHRRHKRRVGP